ncbi:hypothetical protein S7S_18000 [Isoalcanivorax pacificus W11-5]|uniref:Uncharacterized protein n=1 Tax=Isoalcanivorax pacificus W11-5 TaxID=391936 RepID=A0A0B4XUT7_9GAMM|nr:hypothetical protein [Isoalcanivorax pacificus]AJD50012.1 hypothetical protein S7S_18000 [Isoalcanivorax pacificus W11-5]
MFIVIEGHDINFFHTKADAERYVEPEAVEEGVLAFYNESGDRLLVDIVKMKGGARKVVIGGRVGDGSEELALVLSDSIRMAGLVPSMGGLNDLLRQSLAIHGMTR